MNFQYLKNENEQLRRKNTNMIENQKVQVKKIKNNKEQKQKEFEIENIIVKDKYFINDFEIEIKNIIYSLKSKEKEINEIKENMNKWKNETLTKLTTKFKTELNLELDK